MINKDFFAALADLEREKGISEQVFLDALSAALASAYKKQFEGETGNVEVRADEEKGTLRFFLTHVVVDSEEAQEGEITLEEALKKKKSAKPGDVLSEEFVPKDFTRIAAQTAKQVILQKIHETERDNTLSEFSDKERTSTSSSARGRSRGSCSRRIRSPARDMRRATASRCSSSASEAAAGMRRCSSRARRPGSSSASSKRKYPK